MQDPSQPPSPNSPGQPEPEVLPRATRRKFGAKDKLAHLDAVAQLQGTGQIGAYLRENGLYSSQLSTWRQMLDEHGEDALAPKTRGPKPLSQDVLDQRAQAKELEKLRTQNKKLEKKLAQANAIIEVQKKLASLMEILESEESSRSGS